MSDLAQEWDSPSGPTTGVYIVRRESTWVLNVLAGGRVFPGMHGRACSDVTETWLYRTDVAGTVQPDGWWEGSELFESLTNATAYSERLRRLLTPRGAARVRRHAAAL